MTEQPAVETQLTPHNFLSLSMPSVETAVAHIIATRPFPQKIVVACDIDGVFNRSLGEELSLQIRMPQLALTISKLWQITPLPDLVFLTNRIEQYLDGTIRTALFAITAKILRQSLMHDWNERIIATLQHNAPYYITDAIRSFAANPAHIMQVYAHLDNYPLHKPLALLCTNCGKEVGPRLLDVVFRGGRTMMQLGKSTFPSVLDALVVHRKPEQFFYIDSGKQSYEYLLALAQQHESILVTHIAVSHQ